MNWKAAAGMLGATSAGVAGCFGLVAIAVYLGNTFGNTVGLIFIMGVPLVGGSLLFGWLSK